MPDQGNKLPLVDLQVEILNNGQGAFGRRIHLVKLREIHKAVLDQSLLRLRHG